MIEIYWEVDGCSGCSICRKEEKQKTIEALIKAGYTILN